MIENLLLATDFTRRSEPALDRALLLVGGDAARIGVVHVIDPEVSTTLLRGDAGAVPPILAELFDARLPPGAPRPATLVVKGDPHAEILAAAGARDDDLIVLGTPRQRGLLESLRGTTLERVIRASTRPILSVRQPARGPYRRVLFATDLSDISAHALQTARRLGLLEGARLGVVHGLRPKEPPIVGHAGVTIDVMLHELAEAKAAAIRDMRAEVERQDPAAPQAEYLLTEGTPQMALRKAVDEFEPDLVVLGTRGRSGILRLVLGSVAEDLLDWLPVDVLAVPPESKPG